MAEKTALLLIDAQVNMFDPACPAYHADSLLETLKTLLKKARQAHWLVVFVQNNGKEGDPDVHGTPGWEIHPELELLAEDVIIQKYTMDAFHETGLKGILDAQGITRLVAAGLQSEYCVQTTCRKARELGYEVVLVRDGHSTYPDGSHRAEDTIEETNKELEKIFVVVP
ncbi:MAG TPA: isochorismatase family protein, partial [Longilinea sp.]|nr:isochorismatase family protein [Longilinea sp.]